MLEDVKAEIRSDLEELTALDGVSGHEEAVIRALRHKLAPLSDTISVDCFGNVCATVGGSEGYHLLLAAHSDEIGLMVKSVEPEGYLRFSIVGGTQPALLPGRMVRINGSVRGVIGVKSGHLQGPEDRGRLPDPDDLYIDVGAANADEVAALRVRIGDAVAFVSPLVELGRPDIVAGKAIDDRLGCAVLLATMRRLQRERPATRVSCVITTQEEVGLRGAAVAAYSLAPDCAVPVDTFMSGDTPDVDYHREMPAAIGKGPVLLLASGDAAAGNIMHPAMRRLLEQAAQSAGVPYQRATVLGKAATDAASIHLARGGIPTGGIGLARRYSHSPVCTCDLNDAANAVLWLLALVRALESLPSLAFLEE
ncbi:MAG: M20/M25/M40 family metallo-hydrolase [Anaerolineae bacterium]|nr:M20/M25/M40 family metallo-hydrolase [Anaerolineae bacterium]